MGHPDQEIVTPTVLHIVYDLIRGGSEGQCALTAIHLARRGWSQRVAVFRRRGYFLEEVERHCGRVHEIRIRHLLASGTWKEVRRLAAWLRESDVEIVHAWDMDAAIFGGLAARLAGVPFVTSHRDTGDIYPWYKLLLRYLVDRNAAAVTANCEAARDAIRWKRRVGERIHVIPNIFDVEEFDAQSREIFSRRECIPRGWNAVVVSRLDPEKDVECAVEALGRFYAIPAGRGQRLALSPRVNLLVAGEGPQRSRLMTKAREWAVTEHLVLLGEVHDVPALLKEAQAGVLLPRANEGLSNSIIEYMAARLPVVASDCGGNRELVQHGETGWLVPPRAPGAAYHFLKLLYTNRELARRMGERGRSRLARFHPENVVPLFERLYRSAARPAEGGKREEPALSSG
ncbi:MAG TPA: glycosyltransferase [Lentisphaerae bacterium]|nr:glycosyltransferase [Lentisphaerota bacterium]